MDQKSRDLQKRIKSDSVATKLITVFNGIFVIGVLIQFITKVVKPDSLNMSPALILGNFVRVIIVFTTFMILSFFMDQLKKNGKPFTKKNITRLQAIAILTMIGSILPSIVSSVAGMFDHTAVFTLEISFSDIVILLLGAVFGILSEVFRYGYELQQEMDEIA